jgi:hypothetical protein
MRSTDRASVLPRAHQTETTPSPHAPVNPHPPHACSPCLLTPLPTRHRCDPDEKLAVEAKERGQLEICARLVTAGVGAEDQVGDVGRRTALLGNSLPRGGLCKLGTTAATISMRELGTSEFRGSFLVHRILGLVRSVLKSFLPPPWAYRNLLWNWRLYHALHAVPVNHRPC